MKPVTIEQGKVGLSPTSFTITISNPRLLKLFDRKYNKNNRGEYELAYIYFMYDYASEYRHLEKEYRHKKSLELAGLTFDYKISKEMQQAIDEYLEFRETTLLKAVKTLTDTLQNLNQTCSDLNMIVGNKRLTEESTDDQITDRLSLIEKIVNVASKIPQVGDKLLVLEEKAYAEVTKSINTYGDVEISEWEK